MGRAPGWEDRSINASKLLISELREETEGIHGRWGWEAASREIRGTNWGLGDAEYTITYITRSVTAIIG